MDINPAGSSVGRAHAASTAGQIQSTMVASEASGPAPAMYDDIIVIKSQAHRDAPAVQGGEGVNGGKGNKPRFKQDLSGILRGLPKVYGRYSLEKHLPEKTGRAFFRVDNFIEEVNNSPLAQKYGNSIDKKFLDEFVAADKRHQFAENKTLIRATYGYAEGMRDFSLDTPAVQPPPVLYHGTVLENIDSIMKEGLLGMERGHVNLTADKRVALDTAKRHDRGGRSKLCLLEVSALAMHEARDAGHKFYNIEKVWQIKTVPPQYIKVTDWDDREKTA